MDKDMAEAKIELEHGPVGRLRGTGIKLQVTDESGQHVNYGAQLNNTTLEIEALPNLQVEVRGYRAMYEALEGMEEWFRKQGYDRELPEFRALQYALALARGE